jgi:hypothetical protein
MIGEVVIALCPKMQAGIWLECAGKIVPPGQRPLEAGVLRAAGLAKMPLSKCGLKC